MASLDRTYFVDITAYILLSRQYTSHTRHFSRNNTLCTPDTSHTGRLANRTPNTGRRTPDTSQPPTPNTLHGTFLPRLRLCLADHTTQNRRTLPVDIDPSRRLEEEHTEHRRSAYTSVKQYHLCLRMCTRSKYVSICRAVSFKHHPPMSSMPKIQNLALWRTPIPHARESVYPNACVCATQGPEGHSSRQLRCCLDGELSHPYPVPGWRSSAAAVRRRRTGLEDWSPIESLTSPGVS